MEEEAADGCGLWRRLMRDGDVEAQEAAWSGRMADQLGSLALPSNSAWGRHNSPVEGFPVAETLIL